MSGFGSLEFCWKCIWVVGVLVSLGLGRWHFGDRGFGSCHFVGRVFGSLTVYWECVWGVDIFLGVGLGHWYFAKRGFGSLTFFWAWV